MEEKPDKNSSLRLNYAGTPGKTQQSTIHYTCGECGHLFGASVYSVVNVDSDPELADRLSRGELNTLTCSACGSVCLPVLTLTYHDPKARCLALIIPEEMRHQELEARIQVMTALMKDPADIPDYVRPVKVVFGTAGLLQLLDETMVAMAPESKEQQQEQARQALEKTKAALELREEELLSREEDLLAKQEDLISRQVKLDRSLEDLQKQRQQLDIERESLKALALELQSREQLLQSKTSEQIPGATPAASATDKDEFAPADETGDQPRPQQLVDPWLSSGEPTGLLLHEGKVLLLARPEPKIAALFGAEPPELRVQLFDFDTGPVIVIVGLPQQPNAEVTDQQALYWTLNPLAAAEHETLQRLTELFAVRLELYTDDRQLAKKWQIQLPLDDNLRQLLKQIDKVKYPESKRDFEASIGRYHQLGEERLGRKQHNFFPDSFRELATPAAARLALGILAYWSEPENQDYLIRVKSFPLKYWQAIRQRVIGKTIDYGLHLSPDLSHFAIEHKLMPARKDLLRALVANFAEVSLRIKPNDLEPLQELENWKLLLADCVSEKVHVDPEIKELAAAAAKRTGLLEDETAPGGDLSDLSDGELLPLLTDRAQRRDAALELCERGKSELVEPIYRAICNMTRTEVARVIPVFLQLGSPTITYLIKGLKHRKSFIRQGCALALGTLRAQEGIEHLIEILLSEPTNVWKEASRALGDMGPIVVGALIGCVNNADGEGKERLAWALAQAALDATCLTEVEAISRGRDTRLARVATRALEVKVQVKRQEQEVRGAKPVKEQTIVRSFTRQFFDYMAGDVKELSEQEIYEQQVPVLVDDNDILEEAVEVQDEDILASPDR